MDKGEVIKLLADYLKQAVNFSVTKAPEVLQQFLGVQLMFSIIGFIISGALLAFFAVCIKKTAKKDGGYSEAVIFLCAPFLIFLLLTAVFGFRCLAIWLYPEGWLLSSFLKH